MGCISWRLEKIRKQFCERYIIQYEEVGGLGGGITALGLGNGVKRMDWAVTHQRTVDNLYGMSD